MKQKKRDFLQDWQLSSSGSKLSLTKRDAVSKKMSLLRDHKVDTSTGKY